MSKTWKNNELKLSKMFGARRNPLSGSNSGHSMSDTLHEEFYIEIKDGKQSLPTKLWIDTVQKAKHESKIPMLIQHGKQEKLMDARITLKLSDFLTLTGINEPEKATMNPPENKTVKVDFKLMPNKNKR